MSSESSQEVHETPDYKEEHVSVSPSTGADDTAGAQTMTFDNLKEQMSTNKDHVS
jgi:hypothetical protein